ncbi:MAG: pyruvate synthase subunit beta [Deltaproteobacteria bacterium]|nr:pyruvate synthase subunit beta [Deltaproteobacteria bacterium]
MQKTFDIPRELMTEEELLQPGMLSCQGCGASLAMKLALKGLGSALQVPIIHVPFETAAISASGVRAGLDARGEKDVVVMAWAGDGGTFDIGIQSLSGAAERNDDILYVCYDNEAYMNTGIQRSSATPVGAWTTTTPAGSIKEEPKKDIEEIMLAHHIPYMATTSVAYPDDMYMKFKKVRHITGTKFIHLLSPCPPGWRIDPSKSVQITRMATQAKVFPLYEVRRWRFSKKRGRLEENWKYTINIYPDRELPVKEYMKAQGRFQQMTEDMVNDVQERVDRKWDELIRKADGRPLTPNE